MQIAENKTKYEGVRESATERPDQECQLEERPSPKNQDVASESDKLSREERLGFYESTYVTTRCQIKQPVLASALVHTLHQIYRLFPGSNFLETHV